MRLAWGAGGGGLQHASKKAASAGMYVPSAHRCWSLEACANAPPRDCLPPTPLRYIPSKQVLQSTVPVPDKSVKAASECRWQVQLAVEVQGRCLLAYVHLCILTSSPNALLPVPGQTGPHDIPSDN